MAAKRVGLASREGCPCAAPVGAGMSERSCLAQTAGEAGRLGSRVPSAPPLALKPDVAAGGVSRASLKSIAAFNVGRYPQPWPPREVTPQLGKDSPQVGANVQELMFSRKR